VLTLAAVGIHGRHSCMRQTLCAAIVLMWTAAVIPQTPSEYDSLRAELATALAMRGVAATGPGEAAPVVRVSCMKNLRERVCTAELQRGPAREVVMVTGPIAQRSNQPDATAADAVTLPAALQLRPLIADRARILDVATTGDQLLVLGDAALTLYRQTDSGWQLSQTRPITSSVVWPRDLRGRLRVSGQRFDAYLPGVVCRGGLDPLTADCAERAEAWPIGLDNSGVVKARNHFATPEGLEFYGAATLGDGADGRWVVAARDGSLRLLDPARRSQADLGAGGDIAGVVAPRCGAGTYLIATSNDGDALQPFRLDSRRLVAAASPVALNGTVTALWAAPGAAEAMVVTHDAAAGRYAAYRATISCSR
jgi:hypothetical protein